ncbi:MAG: polysaccharide deacetylase family protein, partial [Nitrososphaerota archaeon]|nr:polysaccharide deacetylase family protein [Nitrososphaerota archaeon]
MLNKLVKKRFMSIFLCMLLGLTFVWSVIPDVAVTSAQVSNNKMIALTFDDGPSENTGRLLDILSANNDAKATFFVLGSRMSQYQAVAARAIAQGCDVFGHSWNHDDYTTLTPAALKQDLERTNNAIFSATGVYPDMFRPPYLAYNDNVMSTAEDMGLAIILCALDSDDWRTLNATSIYNQIMSNAKDGTIILCHDIYASTVDAMELVIPALIANGYDLVTVSEILGEPEAGKLYSNGIGDWKGLTHTVMPADDLWIIAAKYYKPGSSIPSTSAMVAAIVALNEITDVNEVPEGLILRIPCTGGGGSFYHEWENDDGVHTDPTCVANECWTYTCVKCDLHYVKETKGTALGHTEVTEIVNATDTEDGYIKVTCSVCGEELSYTVLDATGCLLNYDVAGGVGNPIGGQYKQGISVPISNVVPTKTGYTFAGWLYEGVTYAYGDSFVMPNCNVTLVAQWSSSTSVHVTSATGRAGEEVTLTVSIENNPGIASYSITMRYPDTLTYVSPVVGDFTSNFNADTTIAGQITVTATSPMGTDVSSGRVLFGLTFKINDAIDDCIIDELSGLSLGYYNVNRDGIEHNEHLYQYPIATQPVITVKNAVYGDVNGDDAINMLDVTRLLRYIWNVDSSSTNFVAANADVNGDGVINMLDVTRLLRYIWNVDPSPLGPKMEPTGAQMVMFAAFDLTDPTVSVSSASGYASDEITLTVSLENNPGIASFCLTMQYPNTLTYVGCDPGNIISSNFYVMTNTGQVTVTATSPTGVDVSTGNILFTIKFKINEGAPAGAINGLTLGYFNAGLDGIEHNAKLEHYTIDQGTITVISTTCVHDYVGVVTKVATCAETGLRTYTCSLCGDSYTEVIAKDSANHVGGTYEAVITAATVDAEGLMGIYCSGCDALLDTRIIAPLSVPHFVIYDVAGGVGAPVDNNQYVAGATVTVSSNEPQLSGYTFAGWLYNGVIYFGGDSFVMPSTGVTLVAQWTPIPTFVVVYDVAGGVGAPVDSTQYAPGASVTVSGVVPTRPGYTFAG